jgi:putative ABC transport system permease protein
VGLVLGGVAGATLFRALSSSHPTAPPAFQVVGLAVLTVVLTVALTAVPARLEARRPIPETLRET